MTNTIRTKQREAEPRNDVVFELSALSDAGDFSGDPISSHGGVLWIWLTREFEARRRRSATEWVRQIAMRVVAKTV